MEWAQVHPSYNWVPFRPCQAHIQSWRLVKEKKINTHLQNMIHQYSKKALLSWRTIISRNLPAVQLLWTSLINHLIQTIVFLRMMNSVLKMLLQALVIRIRDHLLLRYVTYFYLQIVEICKFLDLGNCAIPVLMNTQSGCCNVLGLT